MWSFKVFCNIYKVDNENFQSHSLLLSSLLLSLWTRFMDSEKKIVGSNFEVFRGFSSFSK